MAARKIYHVDRDLSMTLAQQKKKLASEYINFEYMFADTGWQRKIHFFADGKKGEEDERPN